jgi:hypothetical protein
MGEIAHPDNTIRLACDGGRILAWLGHGPQEGLMVDAPDVPNALLLLALDCKRANWSFAAAECPVVMPTPGFGVFLYQRRERGTDEPLWFARLYGPTGWWESSYSYQSWRAIAHLALVLVDREVVVTIPEGVVA